MKFEDLEYFIKVADYLNITRAAENLHLSQQALSAKMKKLEDYYGAKLFETLPNRRGLVLTATGELLKASAVQIISLNRSMQNYGFEQQDCCAVSGDLRIGASHYRSRYFLQRVIPDFHKIYPLVTIHISNGASQLLEKKVLNGVIDFALALNTFNVKNIAHINLIDERLFAVIPRKFFPRYLGISEDKLNECEHFRRGISITELQDMPVLLPESDNPTRLAIEALFHKQSMSISPLVEMSDMDSLLKLANSGMGITFGRELLIAYNSLLQSEQCNLVLCPLLEAESVPFAIGYRKDYIPPPFAQYFITLVQSELARYKGCSFLP